MARKVKIKDYEHFKKLRQDKVIKKKMSAAEIAQKYDIGWLQLLAWMARYQTERDAAKAARKAAKK